MHPSEELQAIEDVFNGKIGYLRKRPLKAPSK
jgi:hypothetical protein